MSRAGTSSHWRWVAAWIVFALVILSILAFRLNLSFDLSAFFPSKTTAQSELLLKQLSSGPGSRMLVIGISGAELEDRVETGRLMLDTLQTQPRFSLVYNGEQPTAGTSLPEPLASSYPLMVDIDYSFGSIRAALDERLADISFAGGRALRELIATDLFLVTPDLLEKLGAGAGTDEPWVADDGSAVITAETVAAGTDLLAQEEAVNAVELAFSELKTHPDLQLNITGVGAFGIKLQAIIQNESRLLGILAGGAIMLVLLIVYRSLRLALIASIPLGLGFLAGIAAVAAFHGTVHGITLAFGFTLLGVTVDYPLHLFSHSRSHGGEQGIHSIWHTLRLGAASTAVAYLAMVFSGSQGLAQLGIFAAAGIITAAIATRTLLPGLLPKASADAPPSASETGSRLSVLPSIAGLGLAAAVLFVVASGEVWNDAMDTLSPVPGQLIQQDQQLRSATISADIRYQLSVEANQLENLLILGEQVDDQLDQAIEDGLLEGYSSITTLLPSQAKQKTRLSAFPAAETFTSDLGRAVADSAFAPGVFTRFENVVLSAAQQYPISPDRFENTPLQAWRDIHLFHFSEEWISLYTLEKPDPQALAPLVGTWGEAVRWIDLREASATLMQDFRNDAALAVSVAALIILVLLLVQGITWARLLWIALTVTAALAFAVIMAIVVHGYLTLVHLVALLLVLGLGLDYALFFSRTESSEQRRATVQSIIACAASTTLAFGILSMSTIPLLQFIGLTVACGSVASFVFACFGSRQRS